MPMWPGRNRSRQIRLPKLLVQMGLAASGAEANRKIAEKAVKLDGEVAEGVISLPRCRRGSWCGWESGPRLR
jgi:tyrosyl-tRNA synthetase